MSCPFSSASAGSSTSCTIHVFDNAGTPTGDQGTSALFNAHVQSGGVKLNSNLINIRFVSVGIYLMTFTPSRAGQLVIRVAAGDQGTIQTVEPTSIVVVPGTISSATSILTCGGGENGENSDSTGATSATIASMLTSGIVVESGGISSCKLLLNDAQYNPIVPDATTMSTMTSSINVALRSTTDTYYGYAQYQATTGTFDASVVPHARGRYKLSVEFNNITVGQELSVSVAPTAPDVIRTVLSCPTSAIEKSKTTCQINMYDASNNPANTKICSSNDPIVASVLHNDIVSAGTIVDVKYEGTRCCDKTAIGDETTDGGCTIAATFDLPEDALNGTTLNVRVGLASTFNDVSTQASIRVEGDAYIFGNPAEGRRRFLEGRSEEERSEEERNKEPRNEEARNLNANGEAAMVVRCVGEYVAGDTVTCKTLVTLPANPVLSYETILATSTSTEDEKATAQTKINTITLEMREIVAQELSNFFVTASNAGIERDVETTLAAGGGPVNFEFSHSYPVQRSGETTLIVNYRGGEENLAKDIQFVVGTNIPDSTKSRIECPDTVTVGQEFKCSIQLMDSFDNVIESSSATFPGLETFSTKIFQQLSDGTSTVTEGTMAMDESNRYIIMNSISPTKNGQVSVIVNYGTQELPPVAVQVEPDIADGTTSVIDCEPEIVSGAHVKCAIEAFDQYGNPAVKNVQEVFAGSVRDNNGVDTSINIEQDENGNLFLTYSMGTTGTGEITVIAQTTYMNYNNINNNDNRRLNTNTNNNGVAKKMFTVTSHPSILSADTIEVNCGAHFVVGDFLSCTIQANDAAGLPLANQPRHLQEMKFELEVGGTTEEMITQHTVGATFTSTITADISAEGANIVSTIGGDTETFRRRLNLGTRRARRLPRSSVTIVAGAIDASTSMIWCDTKVSVGTNVRCWIDARDAQGNPTGSSSNSEAFSGVMSGTTNSANGGAPPSTSHSSITYDDTVGLFAVTFTINVHDFYRIQVAYGSVGNNVGSEQHVSSGGTITVLVEKTLAVSANVTCPSYVVAGASLTCTMTTLDSFNNMNADPSSFIAPNATFQVNGQSAIPINGIVAIQSSSSSSTNAWQIVIPYVPTQEGDIRVTYYISGYGSKAIIGVRVVLPATVAKESVLECPTSTVAGTSLTCTVSLKNNSGLVVLDLPVGGADSSDIDTPALTFKIDDGKTETYGTRSSVAVPAVPVFTTSPIGVAVYSASTQLNVVGEYNVTSYFANHLINGSNLYMGIRTITVTPSTPLASTVTVSCQHPSLINHQYIAGTVVTCGIRITDGQKNPAGNSANAAAFHATVTNSAGSPIFSSIAHDPSPSLFGSFALTFIANVTGNVHVALRYDGVDAATTSVPILADVPVSIINATCPTTAVINSTVSCTFVAVDTHHNLIHHIDIEKIRTLLTTQSASVTIGNLVVPYTVHELIHSGDTRTSLFQLNTLSLESADISISFGTGTTPHTTTLSASTIVPAASSITCISTIEAGGTVACTLVGMNANGANAGNVAAAPAWNVQLISSIHGSKNMQVQYQSEGRYTASSSLIHGAGVWIVSGTFGGVVVPMNMTGSSSSTSQSATVVVRSGVVSAAHTAMACPKTSPSGKQLTCIVSAKDRYNNPTGEKSVELSLSAIGLLSDGTPLRTDTFYGNEKGKFNVNFTTPATVKDGSIVSIRGYYLSTPMSSTMSIDSSGGPSSTTSYVVQPDPPTLAIPCSTKQSLMNACVVHRGKWGFTCGQREWKLGGKCGKGELFDVVSGSCKEQCS